jgi:hypothetical protein
MDVLLVNTKLDGAADGAGLEGGVGRGARPRAARGVREDDATPKKDAGR